MSEQKHIGLAPGQAAALTHIDPALLAEGFELIRLEKSNDFRSAIKTHWRAVVWSMVLSFALVMDGYDGAVSSAYFGLPAFQEYFGEPNPNVAGAYAVNINYQTAMSLIGLPGGFLGLYICGWAQERFGSRRTYMAGMLFAICCVFLYVFAVNIGMLLAAQAISACAWGIFNTLTASYAVEICPIQLRGYAAGFISFCWGSGSFIASGINRAALDVPGNWGWRMGYAVQWVWPVPLIVVAFFAPESPWWLVRKGRMDDARKVLTRVAAPGYWDNRNIDAYLAVIQHVDEMERAEAASGSFREMWKGTNLRRTLIVMGVFGVVPVFSGTAMTAYAVQFFESAGMSVATAFNFNLIVNSMNLVGVGFEFILITYFGRRVLMIGGLSILACMLLLIGIFGSVTATTATQNGIGACCAVINLVYHASVGPLTYTFAPEIPTSRLRIRTVAFGRATYNVVYNGTSQLTPRMVATNAWNWQGKAAFFWFGFNVAVTTWCYFCLPETKGKSQGDLDILFSNKISARKFTQVVVHDEADVSDNKVESEHVEDIEDKRVVGMQSGHVLN